MKNRIYSILMLLVVFWWMYGIYYYYYVLNKANITILWNVGDYQVEIYNEKLKIAFSSNCKNNKCELIDLAPLNYEITIKKSWYKSFSTNIFLDKKSTKLVKFSLDKQIILTQVQEKKLSKSQEKIKEIKTMSIVWNAYKYFDLKELGIFYFTQNDDNTINLYKTDLEKQTKLYSFLPAYRTDIDIKEVYWNTDYIYIKYNDEIYIYNVVLWKIFKLNQNYEVKYVKYFDNKFYFILKDSIFYTDLNLKNITNFQLFNDYVNIDDENYLFYISNLDNNLKQKFNLSDKTWDILIKYNLKSKKYSYVQNVSISISKITIEYNNIYIYDNSNKKYLLENIK